MKRHRFFLLNLILALALALGGCTRSRTAEPEPTAQAQSAARVAAEAPAPAREDTAPVAPVIELVAEPVAELVAESAAVSESGTEPLILPPLSRTVNILLLGSDRRPREVNWRTDVLMIIALDLEGQQAAAISFPRDIYLEVIPGHKPNKINVVDYLGEKDEPGNDPDLLASILEEKIGVPIHYFLRFEFESFKQVVDALGGVELVVECRVHEYLPEEDIDLYLEPGTHRLAGKMALGYVRARNQGGDLERARRQQRMVLAVRDQLLAENQLPHLPTLYAALNDSVKTDIGFVDAIRFARFGLNLSAADIHGMVISPPDMVRADWRGGMAVWVANWPNIAEQVQTVFDRPPLLETNTVGAEGDRVQCP
jgi:polyisoprenyl-teichoic acid--peptidoglycan teichoic acid transferase